MKFYLKFQTLTCPDSHFPIQSTKKSYFGVLKTCTNMKNHADRDEYYEYPWQQNCTRKKNNNNRNSHLKLSITTQLYINNTKQKLKTPYWLYCGIASSHFWRLLKKGTVIVGKMLLLTGRFFSKDLLNKFFQFHL